MSIGLYDLDVANYGQIPFNLELMKLSTYYKGKNEIVLLSPTFSPDRYEKFIVRKDYIDGNFPKELGIHPKIEYGGLAFTKNIYNAMDLTIEEKIPDLIIYKRWKKYFEKTKWGIDVFNRMQRAHHLRLSLDGKTIWNKYERQIGSREKKYVLMLHDYNLGKIENSLETIIDLKNNILPKQIGKIGMKFPVQLNDEEQILRWIELPAAEKLFWLQFNGLMDDEAFVTFIQKMGVQQISYNITYLITNGFTEEEVIKKVLPKAFRQVAYSRTKKRIILLKYDDFFFTDTRWEAVINLINSYSTSSNSLKKDFFEKTIRFDSMYRFAYNLKEYSSLPKDIFLKRDVRELFQFVREKNYELFTSFYECNIPKMEGGKFTDGR